MQRPSSLKNVLMLGKMEGKRSRKIDGLSYIGKECTAERLERRDEGQNLTSCREPSASWDSDSKWGFSSFTTYIRIRGCICPSLLSTYYFGTIGLSTGSMEKRMVLKQCPKF